jgi:carbon storage regulator
VAKPERTTATERRLSRCDSCRLKLRSGCESLVKCARKHGRIQQASKREFAVLVLGRKKGEGIRFGDEVRLTVVEIRGEHVRIGIEAPKHIAVHREEVWLRIKAETPDSDCD